MFPQLLQTCPICQGLGFFPNPKVPEKVCKARNDWSATTWYTAWEEACEPYGGAVLTCAKCHGCGKYLTTEGEKIAELKQFLDRIQT